MTEWYEVSTEVLQIAKDLIQDYHPSLKEARIGFVFRDKAGTSQGKTTWANVSKVSLKYKPHLDLDYLIWIAEDIWSDLPKEKKYALIDHELCHCSYDLDEEKASIVGHDIEEFQVILERYGLWNQDLFLAGEAMNKASQVVMSGIFDLPTHTGVVMAVDPERLTGGAT